ncbi:hypothetical protein [Flavobacterium davisii]|nr:hypothetical protein [Flavobacterium davisii]
MYIFRSKVILIYDDKTLTQISIKLRYEAKKTINSKCSRKILEEEIENYFDGQNGSMCLN